MKLLRHEPEKTSPHIERVEQVLRALLLDESNESSDVYAHVKDLLLFHFDKMETELRQSIVQDIQTSLRFNDFQQHLFSWHEVQDLIERTYVRRVASSDVLQNDAEIKSIVESRNDVKKFLEYYFTESVNIQLLDKFDTRSVYVVDNDIPGRFDTTVFFILWYLLFFRYKTILVIDNDSLHVINRLNDFYKSVPENVIKHLNASIVKNNVNEMHFENGSKLFVETPTRAMCANTLNLIVYGCAVPQELRDALRPLLLPAPAGRIINFAH